MSDDTRVSIEADTGTKYQWAKGLFYQQDGKKRTLVSRHVLYVAGLSFLALTGAIIIQGTPEPVSSKSRSDGISSPETIQTQAVHDVPSVANSGGQSIRPTANVRENGTAQKKRFSGPQLVQRPRSGKIPPGSFLKATLLSGASNGPVRAQVTEGFTLNGETLVEQGTILLGNGQSVDDRLTIRFTQMVYRDGAFDTISAQACDADDKIPGLKGSKVGNQALRLASGIGLNFAGGMTTALQDTQGEGGVAITRPTLRNAMLNGAATATLDQSREIMSDMRNKPATFEVPADTEIYVLFQGN